MANPFDPSANAPYAPMPGDEYPAAPWMQPASEPVDVGPFPPPGWFGATGPQELQAPAAPLMGTVPEQAPQLVAPEQGHAPMFQSAPDEPLSSGWTGHAFSSPQPAPAQPEPDLSWGFMGGRQAPAKETAPAAPQDPTQAGVNKELAKTPQEFAKDQALSDEERRQAGLDVIDSGLTDNARQVEENRQYVTDLDAFATKRAAEFDEEAKTIAATKEDRGRWFRNQNVAGKIGAIFSAVMGGLLSANNGGKNSGIDLIMKEMDTDLESQRQDLMTQRVGLGERRGIVADQVARGRTVYEAMETGRMAMLQDLKQKAEVAMGQFDKAGSQYRAAATAMANVDAAIAKSREDQRRQAFKEGIDLRQAKAQQTSAAASWKNAVTNEKELVEKGRQFDETQKGLIARAAAEGMLFNPATSERMGSVATGDKAVAAKVQEKMNAHVGFRAKVAEYQGRLKEYGVGVPGSGALAGQDRAALESLRKEIVVLYGQAISGASVSPQQLEAIDTMFPGVEKLIQRNEPHKIVQGWIERADNSLATELRGAGMKDDVINATFKGIRETQNYDFSGQAGANQKPSDVALAGMNSSDPETVKQAVHSFQQVIRDNPSQAADPAYEDALVNAEKVLGKDVVAGARNELSRTKTDALFAQEFSQYSDGYLSEFTPEQKMILVNAKASGDLKKHGIDDVLERAGKPKQ